MLLSIFNLILSAFLEIGSLCYQLINAALLQPIQSISLFNLPLHASPLITAGLAYYYFYHYFFQTHLEEKERKPITQWLTFCFKLYCTAIFILVGIVHNHSFYLGPLSSLNLALVLSIATYWALDAFFVLLFDPDSQQVRLMSINNQGAYEANWWFRLRNSLISFAVFLIALDIGPDLNHNTLDKIYAITVIGYLITVLASLYYSREKINKRFSLTPVHQSIFSKLRHYWQVLLPSFLILVFMTFLNIIVTSPSHSVMIGFTPLVIISSMLLAADRTLSVSINRFFTKPNQFQKAKKINTELVTDIFRILFLVHTVKLSFLAWGGNLSAIYIESINRDIIELILSIVFLYALAYGLIYHIGCYLSEKLGLKHSLKDSDTTAKAQTMEDGGAGTLDQSTLDRIANIDGVGASRAETAMPLALTALQAAIYTAFTLIFLVVNNIDVAPVAASVGILGIALGFGAQKLVQDVISGFFFLLDDAFRLKEFIEIEDNVKGSVETISLRSVQLRHHLGCVQTVPYSEIRTIKNHSRDWVVVRMDFRLALNTDVERTRHIIQELGDELMLQPEYKGKLLSPLRALGVVMMDENAIIFRTKFTAFPGEQWALRRELYRALMTLFEQQKIRIAAKEITLSINHPEFGYGAWPETSLKEQNPLMQTLRRIANTVRKR